jgi:SpoVK/Ycf46/Vps4 family AAA+-type ATPase
MYMYFLLMTCYDDALRQERKMLFQGFSQNIPMDVSKDELDKLAEELEGWTGSDIDNLCREAALEALREDIDSQKVKRLAECYIPFLSGLINPSSSPG